VIGGSHRRAVRADQGQPPVQRRIMSLSNLHFPNAVLYVGEHGCTKRKLSAGSRISPDSVAGNRPAAIVGRLLSPSFFAPAWDNEKIGRNPAAGIERKADNNDKVRFLSDEEERALLKATDPRFHSHLLLSVQNRIRLSEQYGLKWSQIDLERRQVYLPRTKNGDLPDVPLNGTALSALDCERIRGSRISTRRESTRPVPRRC
jgi:integrase